MNSGYGDLERRVGNVEVRLTWLDEHGTRGVGALQLQVSELIKDQAKLEAQVDRLQERMERDRKTDETRRVAAFRWRVGAAIAATASIAAVFALLADIAAQLH
jgi:hypothetical protein